LAIQLPQLPRSADDAVTRALCHAVYLDDDLRQYILHTVIDPHLKAVCPAYGVNLVAVARHAALAQRRRDVHRAAFIVIRLILVIAVATTIFLHLPAVAVVLLLVGVIAAWLVLFWNLREDYISALRAVTKGGPPEDQAEPLPPDAEDRLRKLDRANTVIYANGEGDPFIGSGRRLHFTQVHPIDITRAGQDHGGKKRTLKAFDAVSLHEYLAIQIPRLGFNGLRARNRLYVRGDYARHVPGLLPDSLAVPEPVVEPKWVKSGVQHPRQRARTYVCLERIMDGGQLVVAMYVRAWIEQNLLSIERIMYFLPPLQSRYLPTRELLARGAAGATRDALANSIRRTVPVLAGKTISGRHPSEFVKQSQRAETLARREIKEGLSYDYGARTSLREAAAAYNTTEHFDESDVLDSFKRLSRRLMDSIEIFLQDHGVDTSEFHQQVQIINQSVNTIGTIQAGTAVVGGHGNIFTGHGAVNNFGSGQANSPPTGGMQGIP
jgi:hypothetical protein